MLKKKPFCIHYENDRSYGPYYGFEEEKAKSILRKLYEILRLEELAFYENIKFIELEREKKETYLLTLKKNAILSRHNRTLREIDPIPPLLLRVRKKEGWKFCVDVLNEFIENDVKFYIYDFDGTAQSEMLVVFDDDMIEKLKTFAEEEGAGFAYFDDSDDILPW